MPQCVNWSIWAVVGLFWDYQTVGQVLCVLESLHKENSGCKTYTYLRAQIGGANAISQCYIDSELGPFCPLTVSCLYFPGSTVWCNPVSSFPVSPGQRCEYDVDDNVWPPSAQTALPSGTHGMLCEFNRDNCKYDSSSQCIGPTGRFECHCQAGYMEPWCKVNMNRSMF